MKRHILPIYWSCGNKTTMEHGSGIGVSIFEARRNAMLGTNHQIIGAVPFPRRHQRLVGGR